jgi:LysR family transcriptional regulator, glycine cleavage system transcriptional activator
MYQPDDEMVIHRLIQEEVGPVCHPDYAKQIQLQSIDAIRHCRILGAKTRPHAWTEWLTSSGYANVHVETHERFEHFYLLIQAAACGLGLAMVPRLLVEDEIRNGHLVAPFGFVVGPHRLDLWINPHLRARKDVRHLIDWLDDEMRQLRPELRS